MPYSYREAAIESAQKYYNYLSENEKGVIIVNVTKIERDNNYFALTLAGRPKALDSMVLKIYNKEFNFDTIKLISFDSKKRILRILPNNEVRILLNRATEKDVWLISDLKFLVKRVEKWYEKYGNALKIPNRIPNIKCYQHDTLIDEPSEDQYAAIIGVLNSPFSYVWGAPGTGKTRFVLARCVLAYIQAGKRILITAPTNNAVEQTLKGVLSVLEEAHIECRGKIIRLGVPSNEFANQYPQICENSEAAKRLSEIADRVAGIETELKIIIQEEKRIVEYKELCESINNLNAAKEYCITAFSEIDKNNIEKEKLNTKLSLTKGCIAVSLSKGEEYSKRIVEIAEKVELVRKKSEVYSKGLRKALWPKKYDECIKLLIELTDTANKIKNKDSENKTILDSYNSELAQLETNLAHIDARQKVITDAIRERVKQWQKLKNIAKTVSENSEPLLKAIEKLEYDYKEKSIYYEYITDDYINSTNLKKAEKETALNVLNAEKRKIEQSSSSINIAECNVIAATIDTCINRILPDGEYKFEHVFLDEAGYCSLIKGATLLAYDCPVTFLGDHRQLPPVCEMNEEKMEQRDNQPVTLWAQSALHAEHVLVNRPEQLFNVYIHKGEPSFNLLQKFDLLHTFRFGKDLASVLAETVYSAGFYGSDTHDTDIFILDAPRMQNAEKRSNPKECKMIVEYVRMHPNEEIGIITPYKKQLKLIKEELRRNRCDDENVMTVHGSQGREWDTVLFSVTDTTDKWFTDSLNEKSNGRNVVNTAVSRAKKKLVIVCEYQYWITQNRQLIGKLLQVSRQL